MGQFMFTIYVDNQYCICVVLYVKLLFRFTKWMYIVVGRGGMV